MQAWHYFMGMGMGMGQGLENAGLALFPEANTQSGYLIHRFLHFRQLCLSKASTSQHSSNTKTATVYRKLML